MGRRLLGSSILGVGLVLLLALAVSSPALLAITNGTNAAGWGVAAIATGLMLLGIFLFFQIGRGALAALGISGFGALVLVLSRLGVLGYFGVK